MNENLRILKPFFKGLPIIIVLVLLAIIVAKKYLNYVTPMYESTAKLRLADINEGTSGANLFKNLDVFASVNKIATEIEVIKSENLIDETLKQLNFGIEIYRKGEIRSTELYNNSPIIIEGFFKNNDAYDKRYNLSITSNSQFTIVEPDTKKEFAGEFGKPIIMNGGKIIVTLNEAFINSKKNLKVIDNYEFEFLSKEKLMTKINKNLDVVSVDKDVPVIRINFKSAIPEKAAAFVNKLAEMYIKDYIENKYKTANTTEDFLTKEIDIAKEKLAKSENSIQSYRDEENIINIPQETETDLRKIAQLKIQKANIKMNLDAIKDLNKYIASGKNNYLDLAPNFEAFTDLLSTEMVKNMKKLQAEKKDLLLTYTPENEKIKVIDQKLKDLTDYQIESIKNTEKNLQIKYNDITKDINESEKVFVGLPGKEKTLNILNRDFSLYEQNYNFLNEKRIEAEIAKSAKIAFHKIISPGKVTKTPVSPIRNMTIIVAALMAFLASVFFIYLFYYLKGKTEDVYSIEKNSTIPVAFATPLIKNNEDIKDNFLNEAIQLELKEIIEKNSIISISSYDKSKDHLFHTLNLAKAFIAQGRKVLIVDVAGQLKNVFPENDYISYADKKYLSYTKAVFKNEINNKLKDYDLCLVHNTSIKENKLSLLFMSIATQNLLVLDTQKTALKSITKIDLLKDEYKLPNVWFVLNKANYNPSLLAETKNFWSKCFKNQNAA